LSLVGSAAGFSGFFSESLQGDQIPKSLFWAAFEVLSQQSAIEFRLIRLDDGIG
jgi:hypothetical protein